MSPIPKQTFDGVSDKFKEIVWSNGIKDAVSEVIIRDAGLKGEGFASLTQYVTVEFEDPHLKPLNLFMKSHTANASHSQMLEELKAFEKEGRFLKEYVAAAEEMCKRKGREGFVDFYPKCYYADDKMVVLENLVLDKGYELMDKQTRQDLELAKIAITTLAKHHAISHAMIQENGGAEKFFERFPNLDYEAFDKPAMITMMGPSFENSIYSNLKILEKSGIEGATSLADKLRSFQGKLMKIVIDSLYQKGDESLLVLGHGDYWNNNMMFLKDKETKKVIHHKAIDLQVTRYNSAAIDLGYYLFTSVQMEVRQRHLKELLQLYLDTFNSVTEDFGHPRNVSYEQLYAEYRRKIGYGFWFGCLVAVGPGMAILSDIDISKTNPNEWADVMDKMVNKWIAENPDKMTEAADELVLFFQEYDELVLQED